MRTALIPGADGAERDELKTSIFRPASTSRSILNWNGLLCAYSTAFEVNMRSPVISGDPESHPGDRQDLVKKLARLAA